MRLEINITNTENLGNIDEVQKEMIEEIVKALVQSGGLTGVKGGKTIIHFDAFGTFMGVELAYWPWRRKKLDKNFR